ncbi:hypothetical protein [Actinomycetospora lemnae]|uniref:Uncharacterized protein n=1 Tax=Actinomycetospora lemnae TaxID=3019891 RepID=A0ABT5STC4_9PSEU|nr:hypothetical protein [Actinomycetospora sp. DW7H6]MDD7965750.1 hypothetical protein [Actinomycetospora sp. DW7H6]
MPATPDPERLRQLLHALSSDDRHDRRPWAGTLGEWWREGTLDAETASTVGTAVTWCAMVDDDAAGGSRARVLASLAALAQDGLLAESDLDRLLRGVDAQYLPDAEKPSVRTLRAALGRKPGGRRDPKGYLWTLVDHVHALTSPDPEERRAAVDKAAAEPGIGPADRQALTTVSEWATA